MPIFANRLKRFKAGISLKAQLTESRLNKILETIESNQILPGKGYRISKTPSGTVLNVQSRSRSSASENFPWKITGLGSEEAEDGWQVTMLPGTINNQLPTNIREPIDWDGPTSGDTFVILNCSVNGQGVESSVVEVSDTAPPTLPFVKGTLDAEVKILLAIIQGTTVYHLYKEIFSLYPRFVMETEKEEILIGEYPFDRWYTWEPSISATNYVEY